MALIESRKSTTAKGVATGIIQNIVKIIVQFLFRSFFIRYLSVDLLGVNSAIAGVLNLLSVTELGLSSVITFNLYKPVADGDEEKINALIKFYRNFYIVIAFIVLGLGLAMLPFLDVLVKDVAHINVNLRVVFILSLISTVATYFCSYRNVLFIAYQNQYKANILNTIINIVSTTMQILAIVIFENYYMYLVVQFIVAILGNIATFICTKRIYKNVVINRHTQTLNKDDKKDILTNVKGMVYHKISAAIIQGADAIIISMFIGALLLGKYSNFSLFTINITQFFQLLSVSLLGAVGNLIAENNADKSFKIYKSLKLGFFWLAGFCSICLFVLLNPAIEVWAEIGKWDANYVWTFDMFTIFIIVLNFYIYSSRIITGTFRECIGNFDKDRFKGVAEALLNIVVSLIFVKYFGIAGVLMGTIISCAITSLWVDPYMVYKYHFKQPLRKHFIDMLFYSLVTCIAGFITYFACTFIDMGGVVGLMLQLGVCLIIPNIIFLLCYFKTKEFQTIKQLVVDFLKSRKGKIDNIDVQNEESLLSVEELVQEGDENECLELEKGIFENYEPIDIIEDK